MHRTDRQERVALLEKWFDLQAREFPDDSFPPDVRDAWETNTRELEEHHAVLAELERRDAQVRRNVLHERMTEAGTDFSHNGNSAGRPRSQPPSDPRRRADLDRALATVERYQERATNRGAVRLENLLRDNDVTGLASRYVTAVGDPSYASAFHKILADPMTGHLRMDEREVDAVRVVTQIAQERALVEGTGSLGGFALPFELDPSIIPTSPGALFPLREIARVKQTAAYQWRGVADVTNVSAAYLAEGTEVSDNSPTLQQPIVTPQRGTAFIPFSLELGMDWGQLVLDLTELLAVARDKLDAAKFLTGTGTNEPTGILSIGTTGALTSTQRQLTATTAVTAVADIYAIRAQLENTVWFAHARWCMNGATRDVIYRFVARASATEPALFSPDDPDGDLLGKPLHVWSTMSSATTTTGSRIAILGDFSGFQIVDRLGSTVELIPHLFGASNRFPTGQRGLFYVWRSNGAVTAATRFQYLEVK